MLSLVLFVSVVSVTSACRCTPKQWEGKEGFMIGMVKDGKPSMIKGLAAVSYDANAEMVAAKEVIFADGKPLHIDVIQDFKKGMQYTIMTEEGKLHCTVTKIPAWTSACVPENATSVGDSYYGAGDDILNTTSYMFTVSGMEVYFTMTKSCIPIAESITGNQKGTGIMMAVGFEGVTVGIKHESVFDVPSICKQQKRYNFRNVSPMMGTFRLRRSIY